MNDPLQNLLLAAKLPKHNLPPTSRYYPMETTQLTGADDQPVIYLKRRFIPPPEHYVAQMRHIVAHRERLDNITARYLSDPEQFWQLADVNAAMQPEELVEQPGRELYIPHAFGFTAL